MNLVVEKSFDEKRSIWKVFIHGELDVSTKEVLTSHLEEILSSEGNIEFYIEELKYLDSTGLGTFVNFYKKLVKEGREARYFGIRSNIEKIIKLTGLEEIFKSGVEH